MKRILTVRHTYFLICFSLFISVASAQNGIIEGRIYNEKNNEPIPFASIIVFGTTSGTTSDIDGKFIIDNVSPGYSKLKASCIGFENHVTEEFLVSNSRTANIDIPMLEKVVLLDKEVVITASPFEQKEESPISMRTLGISDIEKNPGGNRDISKVVQSYPGVASAAAFRNDLIVRGGGPSENRFYLDGVEIPNLNHFATQGASGGPVGIINVDFLREVDLYSGSFPVNLGNAVSCFIDMKQIDPAKDKFNAKISLGASDLALTMNTPLGKKSGLILSVRRSYLQLLFAALKLPFLPTYNDAQFKLKFDINEKTQLSIIGLGAYDQSALNLKANETEEQKYLLDYLPVYNQWNYTIGAVFRHFRKNSYDTWILSRNMLRNGSYKYKENDDSDEENLIYDYSSDEIENKFRYENVTRSYGFKFLYGAGAEYAKYTNSTFQRAFIQGQPFTINSRSFLELYKWQVFGQFSKGIFKERLMLSLGLRTDANTYSTSMSNPLRQISPRLSGSFSINEFWSINFSTGRYYQQPAYTILGYRNNDGVLSNKENGLKYIAVDQYVFGGEYHDQKHLKITLEGFYKSYWNYPFSLRDSICLANMGADFDVVGNEEVISVSKGRAYGAEVLFRLKMWKGFNANMSYTYVRSEFENAQSDYVPSAWDNRHLFNITISKNFKRHWDVGIKWRFLGGTPYTPYDIEQSGLISAWDARGRGYLDFSQFNTLRMQEFHQLDIRIDKQYFFKKWSFGFYIDIQNLYNFKSDSPEILTRVTDNAGQPVIDPSDPSRYLLKTLKIKTGTVLPSVGIIVEI